MTNPTERLQYPRDEERATWDARWTWLRNAEAAPTDRAGIVADLAWQRGYEIAYRTAHSQVTAAIAADVTQTALHHPHARPGLNALAVAALGAAGRLRQENPQLPISHDALAAAHRAAGLGPEPWKVIAADAWNAAVQRGHLDGGLHACTDALVGWRNRGGDRALAGVVVSGVEGRTWVAGLLAGINRDMITGRALTASAIPHPAQLAAQDHAAGAATAALTPAAARRATSPAAPAAARTARVS